MTKMLAKFVLTHPALLVLLLMAYLLVKSGAVQATELQEVYFESADGAPLIAYMMRPKGQGPFPIVIALHGCSGLMNKRGKLYSRHKDWGKRLVKWGFVVLFPESFESRGTGSLCKFKNRQRPVRQSDRVRDAEGAKQWAKRQRFVDRNNISLLGWSNGGMTALRVAYSRRGRGFKNVIAFYPGCISMLRKRNLELKAPLTILMGQEDDWTLPAPCEDLVEMWGGAIKLYKNAYHGFDIPNRPVTIRRGIAYSKYGDGIVHVGTNKKARRQSIKDVRRILLGR